MHPALAAPVLAPPVLAAILLLLPILPAAGQALTPPPSSRAAPGPGYGGFTAAPMPAPVTQDISPSDRAGPPHDGGGPANSIPFSGAPVTAFPRDGGQISPAMRGTSPGDQELPSVSR